MSRLRKCFPVLLSMAIIVSTLFAVPISVSATTPTNYITNGDFSTGDLAGWTIGTNTSNNPVSVSNGMCYIPERLSGNSGDANRRYINQQLTLPAGSYQFSFDADVHYTSSTQNNAFSFGFASMINLSRGRPENNDDVVVDLGSEISVSYESGDSLDTSDETTPNDFTLSPIRYGKATTVLFYPQTAVGRYVGQIVARFTLKKETTFWLCIGSPTVGLYGYIDNISLTKINYISNGDFAQGKKGYMYAEDASTNISIYDNTDLTRPGYGYITLDGKAAYIEGYGGSQYVSHKNNLHYKITDLPAGKYTLSMDVMLNVIDKTKMTLQFGITDALNNPGGSSERAYGKQLINSDTSDGTGTKTTYTGYEPKVTEGGNEIPLTVSHLYHAIGQNRFASTGWHNLELTIDFEITETKTLYFFVFANGSSSYPYTSTTAYANAYVDNVSLSYELPSFNGHSLVLTDAIGVNFFVDLSNLTDSQKAASYMTFEITKGTLDPVEGKQCNFADVKSELIDGNNYGFTCYVNSVQMAEQITPTFHYADKIVEGSDYSVKDYIDYAIAHSSVFGAKAEQGVALVKSIGDYGHYAQVYLGGLPKNNWIPGTDYTVMGGYRENDYDATTDYSDHLSNVSGYAKVNKNISDVGISSSQIKLNLDTNTSITIKLTGNPGIETLVKKNGELYNDEDKVKNIAVSTYCMVDILNLRISELGDVFVITNESESYSVTFSGLSYVYSILNDGSKSSDAKNTVCAIYDYYTNACEYQAPLS